MSDLVKGVFEIYIYGYIKGALAGTPCFMHVVQRIKEYACQYIVENFLHIFTAILHARQLPPHQALPVPTIVLSCNRGTSAMHTHRNTCRKWNSLGVARSKIEVATKKGMHTIH